MANPPSYDSFPTTTTATATDNHLSLPAYTPYPTSSSSPRRSPSPSSSRTRSVLRTPIPSSFNLYSRSALGSYYGYFLAHHQDQPLFAITTHSNVSNLFSSSTPRPDLELRAGPYDDDTVVATADAAMVGTTITMRLPMVGGASASHGSSSGSGGGSRADKMEEMRQRLMAAQGRGRGLVEVKRPDGSFIGTAVRQFTMEIPFYEEGTGGESRRMEKFEWRNSHGEEVSQLGGHWRGRKLVWLTSRSHFPQSGAAGHHYSATDGGEVVAVCTDMNYSGHKNFTFEFLGNGADKAVGTGGGILGEDWALMAIMSALAEWRREEKAQHNNRRQGLMAGSMLGS